MIVHYLLPALYAGRHVIGRLRGHLFSKNNPDRCCCGDGGVGYEVHMPMTCFYELPGMGGGNRLHPLWRCVKMRGAVRIQQ